MRTFFSLVFFFFMITACKSPEEPKDVGLTKGAATVPPCVGSSGNEDTDWHCRGPVVADASNFRFEMKMKYEGVEGVDQSLTMHLPDGLTLTFYSTIRCRSNLDCIPYVARLTAPPQAGVPTQEFTGWVVRIGADQPFRYTRQGDRVIIEFDDGGAEKVEFQIPRQTHQNKVIPVVVQAHGIHAKVVSMKLNPLPPTP